MLCSGQLHLCCHAALTQEMLNNNTSYASLRSPHGVLPNCFAWFQVSSAALNGTFLSIICCVRHRPCLFQL